jgi:hypothetical protein
MGPQGGGPPYQPGAPYPPGPPNQTPIQPGGASQPASWAGVIVGGGMFALGLLGCLATGVAAATLGEGDAVMVSYLGVPLALAGVVAPIAAAVVRQKELPIAVGVPVGCGCLTAVAAVVGVVVFYTAIWPSL